jgi:hypothetical protein
VFHKQEIKQAMKNPAKAIFVIYLLASLIPNQILAISSVADFKNKIPVLDPTISPLDPANRDLLFKRLIATFDYKYEIHRLKNSDKNLADSDTIYYLRQELQALIDMWRATDNPAYLEQAKTLVFKAITDAQLNQRQLLYDNQPRGNWPCFFSKGIEKATGGHGQLYDFQGSAGFMMVATALKQANMDGWQYISVFVEHNIIEKWLYFNPNITFEKLTGSQSNTYLLTVLDSSRDKREHFAGICLDLSELGYQKYPYRDWSQFLFDIYLTEKASLNELYPDALYRSKVPKDWGLYHQEDGTLIWSWGLGYYGTLDTSHANRTSWAVCQAFEKGMLPKKITLNNLIVSFKKNIWAPQKGPFYFNNMIDGTDPPLRMGPGGAGNVWLGWHRLAAYDQTLKELFISIAYDLTNNGPNIIGQNKGMEEAPRCFYAWAARLLAANGQPQEFP